MTRNTLLCLVVATLLSACGNDADKLVGVEGATQAIIDRPAHIDQLPDTIDTLWASNLSLTDVRRACARLPKLTSLQVSRCTGELTEPLPNAPEDLTLEHMEFSLATLDQMAGSASHVSVFKCTIASATSPRNDAKTKPRWLSLMFCDRDSSLAVLGHVDRSTIATLTLYVDEWFDDADLKQLGPYPVIGNLHLQSKSVTLAPGSLTAAQVPKLTHLSIWRSSLDAQAGSTLRELPALSGLALKECVVSPYVFVDLKRAPSLKNVELENCTGYTADDIAFTRLDSSPWQLMER